MSDTHWNHLYGPVPSRRLGRSLGIDLVPYKVCSYDCVYCQLGRTTVHTLQRDEYVDSKEILQEVETWLKEDGQADYLTFSGSGEPTLNSRLGEMVQAVQGMTDIPVVVLTNGSLLWQEKLRAEVCGADLLVPSLDAATPVGFERINRPVEGIEIEQVIEGLRLTRQDCPAEMRLEILLATGYNDSPEELQALREAIELIQPDKVQINTVVRPPAEGGLQALSGEELQHAQQMLGPRAEIIAPLNAREIMAGERERTEDQVMELLRRRPCTLDDIAVGLSMHRNETLKYIDALLARGEITLSRRGDSNFYIPAGASGVSEN